MSPDLTVIILTYNETLHIERCISNIKRLTNKIIIVDSESTDNTLNIASDLGVKYFVNKWPGNQARQFNWALNNISIDTEWVLRLDADEYLTNELCQEIKTRLPNIDNEYSGVVIKRRHVFLDKWVKRGVYPVKLVRLFKHHYAKYDDTWMDEHIILNKGKLIDFNYDFVDHNLNNLSWWSKKHIDYAVREAIELLDLEFSLKGINNSTSPSLTSKRKNSKRLRYIRSPLLFRAFYYFLYRYIFRLGFLDGKAGFLWNFLQGFWYRVLVDAKILEIKSKCGNDRQKIIDYIKTEYNYDI